MGIRPYARHRKVSQTLISQYVKDGRLADALEYTEGPKRPPKINQEKADTILNLLDAENDPGIKTAKSLGKARAAKEAFAAKLAQLSYEQKSGKLCRVDDVERAASNAARITRDSLLTIPDKLAPILAAESDLHNIRKILKKEIDRALLNLARTDLNKIIKGQK